MFLLPSALLLKVPLTLGDVLLRNIIPVLVGNAIAGSLIVAGSYSYQFGKLGEKSRNAFIAKLKKYETRKKQEKKYELRKKQEKLQKLIAYANGE